jgi:hypothetical protein
MIGLGRQVPVCARVARLSTYSNRAQRRPGGQYLSAIGNSARVYPQTALGGPMAALRHWQD